MVRVIIFMHFWSASLKSLGNTGLIKCSKIIFYLLKIYFFFAKARLGFVKLLIFTEFIIFPLGYLNYKIILQYYSATPSYCG
jgi:hypothetical protein